MSWGSPRIAWRRPVDIGVLGQRVQGFLVERGRGRLGNRIQLAFENLGALPAVADGGVVRTLVEIEVDQPAVQLLRQRVERHGSAERGRRGLEIAAGRLVLRELGQRGYRQVVQRHPLLAEPILEAGLAQLQAVEQRTAIKVRRGLQILRRIDRGAPAEFGDIDLRHLAT